MDNGKFVFSAPGSDEVLGEAPMSQGYLRLARIALAKGPIKSPSAEDVGVLASIIAGNRAGIACVPEIDLEHVTEEALADAMCSFDAVIELPGGMEEPDGAEFEENPTGTSGGSC